MPDPVSLTWSPVDWEDPLGGTIRLWPFLPNVVYTSALRRTEGKWDGIAFLLPDDESEIWSSQAEEEKSSPGINRDAIISSGGTLARMMSGMSTIEAIQTCKFPDPEPRRLMQAAQSPSGFGPRPVFFIEPNDNDWTEWVEDCADEMVRVKHLIRSVFSGRVWRKMLRNSIRRTGPPSMERDSNNASGYAQASALAAAWWDRSESVLTTELQMRRDTRLASRLRGALGTLCGGQVDGEEAPVLLTPVMQAWLPSILAALENSPLPEPVGDEEE
ncbi:MAG: hypothetical protein VYA86_05980 [Candidatus Thermoplasmatota archaeon]|nr:hypothetical protein [Candidatus Thermoplasmatota archaeon]